VGPARIGFPDTQRVDLLRPPLIEVLMTRSEEGLPILEQAADVMGDERSVIPRG